MIKNINIEKLKTSLIVVLLFMSILLLYFLWEESTLEKDILHIDSKPETETTNTKIEAVSFLQPFRLRINFSGNKYTVLYTGIDDIWQEFIKSFQDISQSENLYVQEITESDWNEILNYKSIKFDFGYNIPFASMIEMIGANKTSAEDIIKIFSAGAYSLPYPKSFFIYDGENNKYYIMTSEKEYKTILEPLDEIENRNYDKYDPIMSVLGSENNNLMPLSLKNNMHNIICEQEINYYEEENIKTLAEKFFGESFDFVRRIVETNGTVIYMYGYGEKILTVHNNGILEYKEEPNNNNNTISYIEALRNAVDFVSDHGNWQTLNGTHIYPYLKSSEVIESNKKKGYKFNFGYRINGYPVYYQENEAIQVEIIGNQVVYYKRFIVKQKDTLQYMTNDAQNTENKGVGTNNLISNNFQYIKDIYIENEYDFGEKIDEEIFYEIVGSIKMVDVVYYSPARKQNSLDIELIPAWSFTTDQFMLFFDIETGDPLGWEKIE